MSKIWLRQSLDIMVSYHYIQYQKTLMIQSWENLFKDGYTVRQTDGRDWFYRTLSNERRVSKIKLNISRIVSKQVIQFQQGTLNKCRVSFEKILRFLSKSVITNFLINLQLIKSNPNVTGLYQKKFLVTAKFPVYLL